MKPLINYFYHNIKLGKTEIKDSGIPLSNIQSKSLPKEIIFLSWYFTIAGLIILWFSTSFLKLFEFPENVYPNDSPYWVIYVVFKSYFDITHPPYLSTEILYIIICSFWVLIPYLMVIEHQIILSTILLRLFVILTNISYILLIHFMINSPEELEIFPIIISWVAFNAHVTVLYLALEFLNPEARKFSIFTSIIKAIKERLNTSLNTLKTLLSFLCGTTSLLLLIMFFRYIAYSFFKINFYFASIILILAILLRYISRKIWPKV